MDHLLEWTHLLLRWVHIVIGAAWIGTSFYFNWLNNSLRPPEREGAPGVGGELWAVHGGGFYRVLKYKVAPEELPETLHWFKWEAYFTWVTGFLLLCVVYYLGADRALVPADGGLGEGLSVAVGIGSLVVGWLLYDLLCRSPLVKQPHLLAGIGALLIVGIIYGFTQVFSGRGAYIHTGALLGTLMAFNVFRVIIPSQKVMVDAMLKGEEPDPGPGKDAALRSLHNNYFTLPVLFIMISNHFPMTYGDQQSWLILLGIAGAGVFLRHALNLKGQDRPSGLWYPLSALALVSAAFMTRPAPPPPLEEGASLPSDQAALEILMDRCVPCHAAQPTYPGFTAPPAGLLLDSLEQARMSRDKIHTMAIEGVVMPPGNLTSMLEEERETLGLWLRGQP